MKGGVQFGKEENLNLLMLSIEQLLTYQELGPAQRQRLESILIPARVLAAAIMTEFPNTSSEAQQAFSNLCQCVMWTQQAIVARSGTQNAAARSGNVAG